ncbi:MAG: transporter [Gammaproteobacteria bacterium]
MNLLVRAAMCALGLWAGLATSLQAQDLEPRRWAQLPSGINFVGAGLAYSDGDIAFDPVLQIEDGDVELQTLGLSYIRTFGLFGRSARFDVSLPYASGRWNGLLAGEPARVRRLGFGDPRFRLSVLLYGGPALDPAEFPGAPKSNTVVGAAISVIAPLGEYIDDRLINIGGNRWIIRPQLGVTHTRGRWTYELTGSVFYFTDNDRFYQGSTLENDPLYAIQGHLIHTFRPGLWASLSTGYGDGADPTVGGVPKDARTENWLSAITVGLPISGTQGIRLAYLRARTQVPTGADVDTFVVGYSVMF